MVKNISEVITCKAAVCWGPEQPFTVEEIQVQPPSWSEIRVKMLYASICHTDLLWAKGFPIPLYPRVFGHEGVGVVEDVGDGVNDIKKGDTVIPTYIGECKECDNCESGLTNLCMKYPITMHGLMSDGTSRMSVKGVQLYQMLTCSTWSEYTVINVNYIAKVDPSINLRHASFLSCGFSTGFGAAWKEANVQKGSTVAVFGLGAVGLGAVEGARMQGAMRIIGVDKNEKKREKGEAFGMTDFINTNQSDTQSISQRIKEMTGEMGVDYSLECTGVPSLLTEAFEATKPGRGKTIAVGVGSEVNMEINLLSLFPGRSVKGSVFGGIKTKTELPILIHKYLNKEFNLEELLTHEVKLEEIEKALEIVKQPDCVKVVIKI